MNEIIKSLPKTLPEVYSAIIDGTKFGDPIDSIISEKFNSLQEIYDYLEVPDVLTDALYGAPDEDGNYTFPFAVKKVKEGIVEYKGRLGEQYSSYHKETIRQHTAIVVDNLARMIPLRWATYLGVLHDCCKKYCLGTNAKGELCFYGHEYVSALIGGSWARETLKLNDTQLKLIVALIFAHGMPKGEWAQNQEKRWDFFVTLDDYFGDIGTDEDTQNLKEQFGEYIDAIAAADQGCSMVEDILRASSKIEGGEKLISEY
jgi:CRISPR/Cas system-associated endonuclease Cas3-HD